MALNVKVKLFLKCFLSLIFIGYYVSITLFYHSHVVNGETYSHSHFYWSYIDANGKPVSHSHTQDEFITLQIITQLVTTAVMGFLFLGFFLIILYQYKIPVKVFVNTTFNQSGFSLRAPPF